MVAQSFANLVKTNNGFFKSPAQAAFLLSQCVNHQFATSGSVHRNSYVIFYVCDSTGVVRVEKQTAAKGLVVQWERRVAGTVSVQDEREIKRLRRLIKQVQSSIDERREELAAGTYQGNADLACWSEQRDLDSLAELNRMLSTFDK
jgi:hypothetical protein